MGPSCFVLPFETVPKYKRNCKLPKRNCKLPKQVDSNVHDLIQFHEIVKSTRVRLCLGSFLLQCRSDEMSDGYQLIGTVAELRHSLG